KPCPLRRSFELVPCVPPARFAELGRQSTPEPSNPDTRSKKAPRIDDRGDHQRTERAPQGGAVARLEVTEERMKRDEARAEERDEQELPAAGLARVAEQEEQDRNVDVSAAPRQRKRHRKMAEGLVDDRSERSPGELAIRLELGGTRLEVRGVLRDEAHALGPGSPVERQRLLGFAGELGLEVDSRELAFRLAVQPL